MGTRARRISRDRGPTTKVWRSSRDKKEVFSLSSRRQLWKHTKRREKSALQRLNRKIQVLTLYSRQLRSTTAMVESSTKLERALFRRLAICAAKITTASYRRSGFIRGLGMIRAFKGSSSSLKQATYSSLRVMMARAKSGTQRLIGSVFAPTRVIRRPCVISASQMMEESIFLRASTSSLICGTPRQAKSFDHLPIDEHPSVSSSIRLRTSKIFS